MDEFTAGQLLDWYERIEKGILLFGEQVPLASDNERFEAPLLASYLIDAGGLVDSIFRDMTEETVTVSRGNIRRGDCNIIDFSEVHAMKLYLVNTRSIMFVSPPRTRSPFASWKNGDTALDWWKAYNALKHDRLVW